MPLLIPAARGYRAAGRLLALWLAAAGVASCTSQPDAATQPTTAPPTLPTQSELATAPYAGEYRWGKPGAEEPGGILTVYPESDSTVLFQVDAADGAPAYHLVNVLGRATLRGDTAYYFAKAPEDEHGCRLRLTFVPTAATVTSVPGYAQDCMFGGNFTLNETYRRVSRYVPTYVVDSAGDTLRFAQLPPEQLQYEQPLPR